jgi:acyl carrier protein
MEQLNRDVRRFVVDNFLFGESCELSDSDSLLEKGVIDSTGVLELIAFLEEHYGIVVEDREVTPANLDSIGNLSHFIRHKCAVSAQEIVDAS